MKKKKLAQLVGRPKVYQIQLVCAENTIFTHLLLNTLFFLLHNEMFNINIINCYLL